VGYVFGFGPQHVDPLKELVTATWHVSHEDVVGALGKLRVPMVTDALFNATQWIPEYLNYDESRALAVKAIWALGKIDDIEAVRKLEMLSRCEDQILRNSALEQLAKRGNL
jgi:HEAT repeat protein